MNTFEGLWIIAGVFLGYFAPEMLIIFKVRVPLSINLGFAFVGGLVAYTILR